MKPYIIFAALFLSLYSCTIKRHPDPVFTSEEGKSMPIFDLLLTDSLTKVVPAHEQTDNPTVLFYFSPRCPYCRAELDNILKNKPLLNKIHFYLLSNWPFQELKAFSKYYQLYKYQNITVCYDYNSFFMQHFNAIGVPYLAIYNKNKTLSKAYMGEVDPSVIKDEANK